VEVADHIRAAKVDCEGRGCVEGRQRYVYIKMALYLKRLWAFAGKIRVGNGDYDTKLGGSMRSTPFCSLRRTSISFRYRSTYLFAYNLLNDWISVVKEVN
jgi:hypothetical protein